MKQCVTCKESKEFIEFSKSKDRRDGYNSRCRGCTKSIGVKYRKNISHIEKRRERDIKYSKTDQQKLYKREYNQNNKEILAEKRRKYEKNKWVTNPQYKLKKMLRTRLNTELKLRNTRKTNSILKYLDCEIPFFKQHIESQFKPEMTWDNHGKIWEIDHIISCDSFNFTDEKQIKECFHYLNQQPLFKTTEIAKNLGYDNYIGNRNKGNK